MRTLGGLGLVEFRVTNPLNVEGPTYIAAAKDLDDVTYSIVMAYDATGKVIVEVWDNVTIKVGPVHWQDDAIDSEDTAYPPPPPPGFSSLSGYLSEPSPVPSPVLGGGLRKKAPSPSAKKWTSTGRKTKCSDGSKRTLWRCSATGELRVRRVSTRNGKQTTRYVKP
jgi:hypothetical protein